MKTLFGLISSFLLTNSIYGQFDFHYQKAEMISEIVENVRKSKPNRPIYLVVDLRYAKLEFVGGGPAAPLVSPVDANAFDSTELQNLRQIWRGQINNDSIVIVPLNYDEPLEYQRLIDSIYARNAVAKARKYVYLEIYQPIDGWNKLQFYRHDEAFSNGDTVFMRYLLPEIHIPAHIFCETGGNVNIYDEIFTFKISVQNGHTQSRLGNRVRL
jgi:hypothetical protein